MKEFNNNDIKPKQELKPPYFMVMFVGSVIQGVMKCVCGAEVKKLVQDFDTIKCKNCKRSYQISHVLKLIDLDH